MDTFNSGAWRKATRGEIYIGGAWRSFTRAEAYIGATWRTVLSFAKPFSLNVSAFARGFRNATRPSPGTVVTDPATATPAGGTAPYSYSWSIISGTATITTPTQATTTFSAFVNANSIKNATASVTCTDARGQQASGTCELTFNNESDF